MPIQIGDESFALPTENGSQGPTGREIIEIEDAFGLDGLALLAVLSQDQPHPNPKYSRIKALYAIAWIAMTRAGKIVSIDDVLNTYSIDQIKPVDDDPKGETTVAN